MTKLKKCPGNWCDGSAMIHARDGEGKKVVEACDYCGVYACDADAAAAFAAAQGLDKWPKLNAKYRAMRFNTYEGNKLWLKAVDFYGLLEEYSSEADIFEDPDMRDLRAGELDNIFTYSSFDKRTPFIRGIGVPTVWIRRVA